MSSKVIQVQCNSKDFSEVEAQLRKFDEVEAVGSFREKNKDLTTVFVTLADEEKAAALREKVSSIPGVLNEKEKSDKEKSKPTRQKKDLAAEFLLYESLEERARRENDEHQSKSSAPEGRGNGRNHRGRGGRGRGGRGRGQQRGGRGQGNNHQQNGHNQQRSDRGGRRHEKPPLVEASVAFVDNVPFGTPNAQLMEVFSKHGRVLDINRLELMVMVCYDNPESVQLCIQHVNGTNIGGNTVTVSSGTVLVPVKAVSMLAA
ncbi:RNA recognition motif. (a.k.a. RRM, RBD, or RNP domain), putative [Angomonas deanei]|uniref:RNA recognition motif. (A.k.a. RRM, RBD, or RNP domain), putative n=1 Tax=Angomonas deanei TaxID=59799 RepID=A0A7G2CG08_9TRYP|nr:RNA recognition motif. (a.k.a. RRM, RBD, or RNP domain), putative [Angomonas deanei]